MATKKSGPAKKGATKGGAGAEVDLSTHPLVAEGNADPDNIEAPPEVVSLVGYIGPSRRDGYIRLYQDLSFRNYYEIPGESVVGTSPVNPDDENSPTQVRVEPDARVEVVTVSVQSVEARYLSGSISSGFLGAAAAAGTGAQAAQLCTNITTYMPSCVAQQPLCTNITTYIPSCVACNPNCVATVVTSGVPAGGGAGFAAAGGVQPTPPQFCITLYTANPTICGPICLTVVTANPTDCGGPCLTRVTANPTDCGPKQFEAAAVGAGVNVGAGIAAQFCIVTRYPTQCGPICPTYYTANPTNCGPVYCATITYPTRGPICRIGGLPTRIICDTNFPSCLQEVPGQVGPGPVLGARAAAPAAAQPYCITLHTAVPSWCEPCHPIATTAATLCTQNVTVAGPGPCITLHTARPTWCDPPCQPIANTAATLCTQHVTVPDPGTIICPTVYTARPTGCG